jgi:hypothetical protein
VTRSLRAALGAGIFVLCIAPAHDAAASLQILLPSVRTVLTPGPPLAGGSASTPTEVRFPPGMTCEQRVFVGVDRAGTPVSIAVVQRLVLNKLGDYTFAVPGPFLDVEAAPGSESDPGLRHDAILWSGFSSGKRTLAARATLRVGPGSKLLPLRVSVKRDGDVVVVRGENSSAARGPVFRGPLSAQEASKAFGETRRSLPLGRAAPDLYATVPRPPLSQSESIAAPLDVRGQFGGVRFRYRLGDGGPMSFERRITNTAPGAKLRLTVTPVAPAHMLNPPGAASWVEAARRGRIDRSSLLERVSRVRLTVARALQYQAFLANPDPNAPSNAVYVYETAAPRAVATPNTSHDEETNGLWPAVLLAVVAVGGTVGLVVLWAHS